MSAALPEGVTRMAQVTTQVVSIGYVAILGPVLTLVILSVLKLIFGDLSASAEGEHAGLDLSEHSESAYVG